MQPVSPAPGLIAVGRVVDAYGVKGWVKVDPFNEPGESVLRSARHWWLDDGRRIAIESARVHGASIVAKPEDSHDRDAALALCGEPISIAREAFPQGKEGEVYWVDLLGCVVRNREGLELGEVARVEDHGAHPILVVRDASRHERMIPYVGAYVDAVDAGARRIDVDWQPEY
ncbi:MAG: 16S rRNA processing protein RimM [Burkholderiaceae bacterium]|nr:16S rRNA processing protein RimM [Burkholderiaceae bacterium]